MTPCEVCGKPAKGKCCSRSCRSKRWKKANPESVIKHKKKYREANPEKERERHKKYREANPEKLRAKNKKYVKTLQDSYVKNMLKYQSSIRNPTKEQIEQRKLTIKIKRKINEIRKTITQ